ncbi:MAG: c-type cytochrome [Acidobacteria bacterium]|nr:c-type cytochrome [Acidobacteriota bacterium]MDW7984905.1 c-type cytochrome [Acidobacteriota bacterium]
MRQGRRILLPILGFLIGGAPIGLSFLSAQDSLKNPYAGNAEAAKEGYAIYQKMGCPGCHGAGGGGGMGWALIDCIWRFGWDDATLFRLIKGQIPEQTMPRGFGDVLTDDQVWKIITWVRTVNHCEENVIGQPTAATTAPTSPEVAAQEQEKACRLVAINPSMIRQTLQSFPDYASTYVILYREDVTKPIRSLEDIALSKLRVGVNADTPVVDLLKKAGASNVTTYSLSEGSLGQIVTDVLDQKIDVAVVWAPLAGFFIWQSDSEHRLTAIPLAMVLTAPTPFHSAEASSMTYVQRCQQFLHGVLESYGVVPAQVLTAGSNAH